MGHIGWSVILMGMYSKTLKANDTPMKQPGILSGFRFIDPSSEAVYLEPSVRMPDGISSS